MEEKKRYIVIKEECWGDNKGEILGVVAAPKTGIKKINAEAQRFLEECDNNPELKYPNHKIDIPSEEVGDEDLDKSYIVYLKGLGTIYKSIVYRDVYKLYMREVPLYVAKACMAKKGKTEIIGNYINLS